MSACTDFLSCMFAYLPHVFDAAFAIVAAASTVAAITPTPADDRFVGRVYKVIDLLALNVGYAKEKPTKKGGRFVPN